MVLVAEPNLNNSKTMPLDEHGFLVTTGDWGVVER